MQTMMIRGDQPLFFHKLRGPLLRLWEKAGIDSLEQVEGAACSGLAGRVRAEAENQEARLGVANQKVRPGAANQNQAVQPHKTHFEAFLQRAENFRTTCPPDVWQKETEALRQLWTMIEPEACRKNVQILVQPLVIPARLPVAALPLLDGWNVHEDPHIPPEQFSPLVLLWLQETGAKPIGTISGKIKRVEAGDGVAVFFADMNDPAGCGESRTGIPVVHEYRDHGVEHIDEGMFLLQANLDDSSPEWMAHAMERLLEAGANDVHFLPVTMKKSRPGVLVQVLCYQSRLEELKSVLFQETTTFGIRYFPVACHRLARQFATVKTQWGEVPVKIGLHRGKQVQCSPEYAVCAQLAKEAGIPVKQVHQEALSLALAMKVR
ncbi:nickel insertion protein [Brevibacillus sp. FSL K6-6036]|uniref:nickel insertion protein n=1 Tax=unclassified Brevibacillus TaxID=2684853 RepID=UPI0030CD3164